MGCWEGLDRAGMSYRAWEGMCGSLLPFALACPQPCPRCRPLPLTLPFSWSFLPSSSFFLPFFSPPSSLFTDVSPLPYNLLRFSASSLCPGFLPISSPPLPQLSCPLTSTSSTSLIFHPHCPLFKSHLPCTCSCSWCSSSPSALHALFPWGPCPPHS